MLKRIVTIACAAIAPMTIFAQGVKQSAVIPTLSLRPWAATWPKSASIAHTLALSTPATGPALVSPAKPGPAGVPAGYPVVVPKAAGMPLCNMPVTGATSTAAAHDGGIQQPANEAVPIPTQRAECSNALAAQPGAAGHLDKITPVPKPN